MKAPSLRRPRGAGRRLSSPAGLTLLELLLALALTTFILAAISMAIDLHLRTLDVRRTDVEESQLAQALLQMMARDLRNAVQTPPADEGLDFESLAAEELMSELEGTEGFEELEGLEGVKEIEGMLGEAGGLAESEGSQEIAESVTLPPTLGLYGTQYELQVDVSRLPRVEEYEQFVEAGETFSLIDIPSDVKTVAYYMLAPGTAGSAATAGVRSFNSQLGLTEDDFQQGGLVRRQLDRAVSLYAMESGSLSGQEGGAELIAPEVTGLEFRYGASSGWVTEWDSEELGGLPLAVEIVIAVRSAIASNAQTASPTTLAADDASYSSDLVFRLVVPLPVAKELSEESEGSGELEELGL